MARIFLNGIFILTIGSDSGKVKMIKTDVDCFICCFKTNRKRGQFAAGRWEGKSHILLSTFRRDKSTEQAIDDGKRQFYFSSNNSNNQTIKIQHKVFASKFEKKQGVPL